MTKHAENLLHDYCKIRKQTEMLCEPLALEDYVIQSMPDVSPPKWHLAHTTWFFETFILMPHFTGYKQLNPLFQHLFNSYYQSLGHPFPRAERGLLSRPTVEDIYNYRHYVDDAINQFFLQADAQSNANMQKIFELGLHHEQQHQELLLMDIKHNLSLHPHFPIYVATTDNHKSVVNLPMQFFMVEGGVISIGSEGKHFCFDNEMPQHQNLLKPYALGNRLVNNAEYLAFIEAGGYLKPEYWLADGWDFVQKNLVRAPLYWYQFDNKWYVYTLSGLKKLNLFEPVVHVTYYEADAYARWCGMRLPLEAEWENVANHSANANMGNFLENQSFHPLPLRNDNDLQIPQQLLGDVWEWTMSSYSPYPGYKPASGALGEYNGKFMSNQLVLKGGSCITPQSHIRPSYRNFFQPDKRWQFSGIRLAKDA